MWIDPHPLLHQLLSCILAKITSIVYQMIGDTISYEVPLLISSFGIWLAALLLSCHHHGSAPADTLSSTIESLYPF